MGDGEITIHKACWTNNIEMVKLLLKYGGDPNVVEKRKGKYRNMTTMHIAALNSNVKMMKLLIESNFDTNKLINNIIMSDKYRYTSVFLILCSIGDVECLKYLLSICQTNINNNNNNTNNNSSNNSNTDYCQLQLKRAKNSHSNHNGVILDVLIRDGNGHNGLYLAVKYSRSSMCRYLLSNVYNNNDLRQEIMNQCAQSNNFHISMLAAKQTTKHKCVSVLKCLIEYKCNLNYDKNHPAIRYAVMYSPPILTYMLDKQLYTLTKNVFPKHLIDWMIKGSKSKEVCKQNIKIICKHINSKQQLQLQQQKNGNYNYKFVNNSNINNINNSDGRMNINSKYQEEILDVLQSICYFGSFDKHFDLFKCAITTFLSIENIQHWTKFYKSKISICKNIIDKLVLNSNKMGKKISDKEWNILLINMSTAYKNEDTWHKVSQQFILNDKQQINNTKNKKDKYGYYDFNVSYYKCNKNHRMRNLNCNSNINETKNDHDTNNIDFKSKPMKCIKCNNIKQDLDFVCDVCNESICVNCNAVYSDIFDLNKKLRDKKFSRFDKKIKKYDKNSVVVSQVLFFLSLSFSFSFWFFVLHHKFHFPFAFIFFD